MSVVLQIDGKPVTLGEVVRKGEEIAFTLNGKIYRFRGERKANGGFVLEEETAPGVWRRVAGNISPSGKGALRVQIGALEANISQALIAASHATAVGALSPTAPMPGLVRQILAKVGDAVKQDQALAVMEAMKLQLTLSAGGDGVVEAVLAKEGEMVSEGAEIVRVKAK